MYINPQLKLRGAAAGVLVSFIGGFVVSESVKKRRSIVKQRVVGSPLTAAAPASKSDWGFGFFIGGFVFQKMLGTEKNNSL